MTITTIEKAAMLMGLALSELYDDIGDNGGIERHGFNPYTNKADLSDVIDELQISVTWKFDKYWDDWRVIANKDRSIKVSWSKEHPTKFAAKAEAVMAVVEQIYDERFGKDGE